MAAPPSEKDVDGQDKTENGVASSDLDVAIDVKAERQVIRKLDMWIVPPVMLLYLFRLDCLRHRSSYSH
jgi:hypothetical protein